ncbi:hypothetical protein JW711_01355 [Candidatus Woesearchaeota archaeon]|nr:hypothetical protein [Candidatus Woesearchaeota archaeon]
MELSLTELKILENIGKGIVVPKELARAVNRSVQQTSLSLRSLEKKEMLLRKRRQIDLSQKTHVALLVRQLVVHPNLKELLSDSGIAVLTASLNPLNVCEIMQKSGFGKSIVYRKIKQAFNVSVIRKNTGKYSFNDVIWPDLKEFLVELRNYELAVDPRLPQDGVIYYKNDSEILFSTIQERDASLTAFSAYKDCGLEIYSHVNYYHLPKKTLSLREIFRHSLFVVETTKEYWGILYVALFYLKHKKSLKGIHSPILEQLHKVICGEKIKDYPDLRDIQEKAEQYNIKVQE